MGIKKQVAEVWFAPTRNRRYFSKEAAASAEARSIIYKKYPREPIEYDTGHSFDIEIDNPEAYEKMHRRLYRKIINEMLISEGVV